MSYSKFFSLFRSLVIKIGRDKDGHILRSQSREVAPSFQFKLHVEARIETLVARQQVTLGRPHIVSVVK